MSEQPLERIVVIADDDPAAPWSYVAHYERREGEAGWQAVGPTGAGSDKHQAMVHLLSLNEAAKAYFARRRAS